MVLRDLPDGDDELHTFLLGEGLLRLPVPDSWVRPVDFTDDEGFLAGLTRKHRYHQRTRVLASEPAFDVQVLEGGGPEAAALPALVRDHLYGLYRAVHGRAYDLNVLPLPRRLIDAVLASPAFEVVLLRLPEANGTDVVAFAVQHVGSGHVAPLFVGLDYAFVRDPRELPGAAAPGPAKRAAPGCAAGAVRDGRRPAEGAVRRAPGEAVGVRGGQRDLQRRRAGAPGRERRRPLTAGQTSHGVGASSRGGVELGPGGVLPVEGSALEAAVQDADEPVGQLAKGGVVAGAASSDRVVVGAGAG